MKKYILRLIDDKIFELKKYLAANTLNEDRYKECDEKWKVSMRKHIEGLKKKIALAEKHRDNFIKRVK